MLDEWRRFWGKPALAFGVSFGFWILIWALVSGQAIHSYHSREMAIPWAHLLLSLGDYVQWGLVSPFVVWFCARRPVARGDVPGATAFQFAAWVVIPAVFVLPIFLWHAGLATAFARPDLALKVSLAAFLRLYIWAFLAYLDIGVAAHAFVYARELKAREVRASQLEARLAEARLETLRAQIHPHFLFNTMNSVVTLMHRDVRSAERMLVLLGDLLRESLSGDGGQTVPLERELGFLDRYIEIEKTRFGDRLTVTRRIDPLALSADVPSLLLQPLVENALRHGVGRKPGPGHLTLTASLDASTLELRVADDGPGRSQGDVPSGTGVGLTNTRARLEQMYGAGHSFLTGEPEGGGFEVVVRIPFRAMSETVPAEDVV